MKKSNSPYLLTENRLSDVIAAIQALGSYKYYKMTFIGWADRISADASKAEYWRSIFEQHPEFFRLDEKREKVSLVWRRQYPKRYHIDKGIEITHEEYLRARSDSTEFARLSRNTLNSQEIQSLIATAIELHSRALQLQQERRWWIPVLSIIAGLIGAILGGWLSK